MFQVMIVDDMEIMRRELKSLKIWGKRTGFIVAEEAKDGQDAIKKLKEKKVDLVITDIKMPIADGIELLKKIIDKKLSYCVVLLSEYSEFEYARQGIVYGAFDYIVKPIDEEKIEGLLVKVAKYIEKKKLEEEKVKKLENELEEKLEIFYAPEDVEKIINLFKDVDVKVIEVAFNLVETIGAAVDYDSLKVEYVLKRVTSTLIEALKEIYPWLPKLVCISKYTDIDFTKTLSFSDMKTIFLGIIRKLIMDIKKFQFGSEMNSMVRNICKIVLERMDTEVSVRIIADHMFLNQSYLSTLYKEKTGNSLVEYITMVKMERAKMLLHNSNIKNYEIASKLGYKDVEYFGRLFKKYTTMTPSKFKASCTCTDKENG
ncbi:response regulator [Clostridium sp. JS66]|uniref:response regulator transcription factor n=1 Tax=Clostridium sp. JS66 TaxID=3064705 RepID=UPI00298EB372|nr:response regulator [Clostridium sp. JS66]WPC44322.1 response regulator [Clostridium sp. JS66]